MIENWATQIYYWKNFRKAKNPETKALKLFFHFFHEIWTWKIFLNLGVLWFSPIFKEFAFSKIFKKISNIAEKFVFSQNNYVKNLRQDSFSVWRHYTNFGWKCSQICVPFAWGLRGCEAPRGPTKPLWNLGESRCRGILGRRTGRLRPERRKCREAGMPKFFSVIPKFFVHNVHCSRIF